MKLSSKLLLVIILITISGTIYSQESEKNPTIDYKNQPEKLIDYEFKGSLLLEQQSSLENEIKQMLFVRGAKVILKSEKQTGVARVQVKEYYTNKDTDFEFDIYKLKMLLAKFGLTPTEYRTQIISNK